MSRPLLKMEDRALRVGRLCGLGNLLKLNVLGVMGSESGGEVRELFAGIEPPEALGGLDHAGGSPAQRHAGITPAFDVAADAPDGAVHVLDDVGAGERAPEVRGQ